VTADQIANVDELTLETRVNGIVMQHASLADLLLPVPDLVEYVSRFTSLSPGDVIATGTPGSSRQRSTPQRPLQHGDVVEVEITGLGLLRNRVGTAAGE
jgi:2-keto-4-pentenoate hydratase/2-oxohepta-3-ene-1,7-dioic acid hydratase in catechol pathway